MLSLLEYDVPVLLLLPQAEHAIVKDNKKNRNSDFLIAVTSRLFS